MELTPQTLHDAEFREAKRGGYHHGDVDDFLEKVEIGLQALLDDRNETRRRLDEAQSRVAAAEARAEAAERRVAEAGDADDSLKRTLVLAQRTADAAVAEAKEEASRTVASARDQADRLLAEANDVVARARAEAEAEARRTEEETRAAVLAELHDLEGRRTQLQADVDAFEHHLERQRAQVRAALAELRRLLDDPSALQVVPPPPVTEVEIPERPRPLVADPTPRGADPAAQPDPGDERAAPAAADEPGAGAEVAADEPGAEVDAEPGSDAAGAEPEPERDLGPSTQPVDVLAERDADDDAYLAELRKAMTDESPLGPRDDLDDESDLFDQGSDRSGRSRFGRRG